MNLLEFLKQEKVYGIVREDNVSKAIDIAQSYIQGGLKIIELNCPLDVTKEISRNFNVLISQGGIITSSQAHDALNAGAHIISSPIFHQNLVHFASCHSTYFLPSVTTPNEAYNAWKSRSLIVKIYPAAVMGGVRYVKELIKPMPFLNVLPCSFVKLNEIQEYLDVGAVAVGVGREFYKIENSSEMIDVIKNTISQLR